MKTKRANQNYTCSVCKAEINKGEQYALKGRTVRSTCWAHDTPVPDWAWEKQVIKSPICGNCATK